MYVKMNAHKKSYCYLSFTVKAVQTIFQIQMIMIADSHFRNTNNVDKKNNSKIPKKLHIVNPIK